MFKPFNYKFHKKDMKHNKVRIPFITKSIPTINVFNSKLQIKDKVTRTIKTFLNFFSTT